jgi:hypothetical protein
VLKKIIIGILEDVDCLYFPWEIASLVTRRPSSTMWLKSFKECFENLAKVDILIADWEITDPVLQTSEYLFDYIVEIRSKFPGPIVLYSVNKPPKKYDAYFSLILNNPDKSPPDLDWLMDSVLTVPLPK